MTDIHNLPAGEPAPQLVELLFERTQVPLRYLRPVEVGAAYYDLSRVERAVDPAVASEEDMQSAAERRTWEPLGPVYLLEQTLQTLRWSNSPEPATYHVGRVPAAAAYRLQGVHGEFTLSELVRELEQGPVAFRGYPVAVPAGSAPRLQFTPNRAGETSRESGEWENVRKWLRPGREDVRDGVHYQRYEEVSADGSPAGMSYIGQLMAEGEWLSESGSVAAVAKWLKQPGAVTGANF